MFRRIGPLNGDGAYGTTPDPARVVMELVGHSQIRTTLDMYSHVLPTLQQEAAVKMDALLSAGG